MVESPPDWPELITTYRNQTGKWPERIYLHPEDYRRTVEHLAATLIEMPLTSVETALWGVPAEVVEWVPEGAPVLVPPAFPDADQLYPLFPASPSVWAFGNRRGDVVTGLGPYWPDPPFTIQQVPPKTVAWRYILPLKPQPVSMLSEVPPTKVDLDIRVTTLHRWAWAEGRHVTADWYVGWAPEIHTYLLWECAAHA